jgi:cytochrome P450
MTDRAASNLPPSDRAMAAVLARKAGSLRMRLRTVLGRGALPNAIIIGAMKCGTTSLFDYLIQHPDVCGSRTKELHFFDNQYARGERWYRANFAPRGERVLLESSPYYLFHPLAPERAAALVPGAKLIVLLRDPADRAYSHYNQNHEEGLEPLPFEDALAAEGDRLAGTEEALASGTVARSDAHQTFSYAAKGRYAPQLRRWLEHYARERMLFVKAEDFFRAPQDTVDRVTDFLGIARFAIGDLTPANSRRYPLMHPETRAGLERGFEGPNAEVQALTGIEWKRRSPRTALQPEEIDLQSSHLLRAPWQGYEAVRAHGPVVWLPRQRFWLVVGHRAAEEALARPGLFSSAPYRSFDPVLAGADPPEHGRGRALAADALGEHAMERSVAAAVGEAEARIRPALDAVGDFASPVAAAALAALLGVPGPVPSSNLSTPPKTVQTAEAYRNLIAAGVAPADAASLFRVIWTAGTVALGRTLGWAVYELLRDPALSARIAADPALAGPFVEEVVRLHPPTHMLQRIAAQATELAGTAIPKGAPVQLCVSAANRDPNVFPEPDRIDLERGDTRHLGFGGGPHACLGAGLARTIVPPILLMLVRRGLQPAPGREEPRFDASVDALVPTSLPVALRDG